MDLPSYSEPEIARIYDAYCRRLKNRNIYFSIAHRLVRSAALGKKSLVVDLGCGTGESTRAILQAIGKEGSVIGVDPSESMIQAARLNVQASNAAFNVATGESAHTWIQKESVDAVVCSGAMWQMDLALTLAAARKVLKAHGSFAFNVRWDVMPGDLPLSKLTARFMSEFDAKSVETARSLEPGFDAAAAARPQRRQFQFIELYKLFPTAGFTLIQCKVYELSISPNDFLAWLECPREASRFLPGLAPEKQKASFAQAVKVLKPKAIRQKFADVILYRD